MSGRIKRAASGQFAAGQSGNPKGARLRKPKELLSLTDLHRIALEVGSETVGYRDGKPVSRYENGVRTLSSGDSSKRLATRDFLEVSRSAASYLEHAARREAQKRGS